MKRIAFACLSCALLGCGSSDLSRHASESIGSVEQADIFTPRPNVGLDFIGGGPNGTPQPLGPNEIAGLIPYSFWRSVPGAAGSQSNVNTADGGAAQIAVQWSSDAAFSTGIADNGGNSRMMKGYLNTSNTSTTTVTFSNLPPSGFPGEFGYATADIYVYFDGSNLAADRIGIYTLDTGTPPTRTISGKDASGVQFSGTFTPVTVSGATGNVIKFSKVPLADSFTLTATPGSSGDASKRAPVNAIQIVPDADGIVPTASLVQAADGALYGANSLGGAFGIGTTFSITTTGAFSLLHTFPSDFVAGVPDGKNPVTRFDIGPDGNFYGTTELGGANDSGVVFRMTPSGAITVLHAFGGSDGVRPTGRLVVGGDGALYGTTSGGSSATGTVYRITRDGASFTTLHAFAADGSEGRGPNGVKFLADGNFYGTTSAGSSGATAFRVTPGGALTLLHNFTLADGGGQPNNKLTLGVDGKLYGTTTGGAVGSGTVFTLTASGAFATLFSFTNSTTQGAFPLGEIFRASDNTLYGVTRDGGANNGGTVYKIANGVVTPAWFSFPAGFAPSAGLLQGTDGNLYGVSQGTGTTSPGTVYQLTTSRVFTVLHSF